MYRTAQQLWNHFRKRKQLWTNF